MRYALLVCHDENAAISAQERSRRAGAFTSFQDEMSASGVLVGSERLHPTETASIVRAWDGGDVEKFGERAADASADAIDAAAKLLRRWIVRLYESRRAPQGVLILTDRDRGLDIVMPRDLSPDAYRQLTQILEALPSGMANRPSELRWTGVRWVQQAL